MSSQVAFEGAYTAERTAALAGVPKSAVYYFARTELVIPSVSCARGSLWSYADLMGLRIAQWLRHKKPSARGTPMTQVRRALQQLSERGVDVWMSRDASGGSAPIWVDTSGEIHLSCEECIEDLHGQGELGGVLLDLLSPFESGSIHGPDLIHPRPHLRIVPGKLVGQPHLERSRVSTPAISALAERGFDLNVICEMYPDQDNEALREAIDLEAQLSRNLQAVA